MKAVLLLLSLPLALGVRAQSTGEHKVHTLFPADSVTGVYTALTGGSLHTMGQDAFVLGGRIGVVLGHRFAFGLAGYGLCNPLTSHAYGDYRVQHELVLPDGIGFRMGYGGLFAEPILFDRSVVHLSIPITFGAGGAGYGYRSDGERYTHVVRTDGQAFFFIQPAVDVEVNIIPAVRLGIGAAYLFTSDIDLPATARDVLRRPMLQVTLKAGAF